MAFLTFYPTPGTESVATGMFSSTPEAEVEASNRIAQSVVQTVADAKTPAMNRARAIAPYLQDATVARKMLLLASRAVSKGYDSLQLYSGMDWYAGAGTAAADLLKQKYDFIIVMWDELPWEGRLPLHVAQKAALIVVQSLDSMKYVQEQAAASANESWAQTFMTSFQEILTGTFTGIGEVIGTIVRATGAGLRPIGTALLETVFHLGLIIVPCVLLYGGWRRITGDAPFPRFEGARSKIKGALARPVKLPFTKP